MHPPIEIAHWSLTRTFVAVLFIAGAVGSEFSCGKHADSGSGASGANPVPHEAQREVLEPLPTKYSGLIGEWELTDSAQSWGDLGSEVLRLEISATEISYEKSGHMAQEDLAFNAGSARFVGDCHYRIHAREFGVSIRNGADPWIAGYPDHVELVADAANHADCSDQVERLNHLNDKYHPLRFVSGIDAAGIATGTISLIPGFGFRPRSHYARRP